MLLNCMISLTAIIMPDDVAEEKVKALLSLGAQVERVRPASIIDKKQVRVFLNFIRPKPELMSHFSSSCVSPRHYY